MSDDVKVVYIIDGTEYEELSDKMEVLQIG